MKPIYIYKPHTKSYKIFYIIGFLLLIIGIIALVAPLFIKTYINKIGADEKGYAFRIGDLDLNPLRSQIRLHDVEAYNIKSSVNFAEAKDVKIKYNLIDLIKNEKRIKLYVNEVNLIVSKDLFEEINRIKNEAKEETADELYIDEIDADVASLNVRDLRKDNIRTLLSLQDASIRLKDFGFGNINEKTEFKINSKITEGGTIALTGKTRLEAEDTPWTISGEMAGISAGVIEKMAGDKIPLEIKEANIRTIITAQSQGGHIEGILSPDIKNFKITEDKNEGPLKRNIAKVTNLFLKDATEGDKEIKLEIPFTLNENFTLNFQETLKKLK